MKTPTSPNAAPDAASTKPPPVRDARVGDLMNAALARFNARRATSQAASQQAIQVRALCW